jgi:hypothetical protein
MGVPHLHTTLIWWIDKKIDGAKDFIQWSGAFERAEAVRAAVERRLDRANRPNCVFSSFAIRPTSVATSSYRSLANVVTSNRRHHDHLSDRALPVRRADRADLAHHVCLRDHVDPAGRDLKFEEA